VTNLHPTAAKILAILTEAAENSIPCPSNEEIQEVIGYKQITTASRAVTALNESGLISVSIVDNRRTVTITSSGKGRPTEPSERSGSHTDTGPFAVCW